MNAKHIFPFLILLVSFSACKKFLDVKPNQSDVVPSTLTDLQALLDDYQNIRFDPVAAEISADDYYLTDQDWAAMVYDTDRRLYTWEKDNLFQSPANDWLYIYRTVYRANVVLDQNKKIARNSDNQNTWDNVEGQALFLRARSLLSASISWTNAYDGNTAEKDLGMPVRVESDFNIPSARSNLKQTYEQIINDLKQATELLPVNAVHVSRPSKRAALGLLARTYLLMRDYNNCLQYANACLALPNTLMDYNDLKLTDAYPMKLFNAEVIYDCYMPSPQPLNPVRAKIEPKLYSMYEDGDLRKTLFFRSNNNGTYGFKGSYRGGAAPFSGIATDEIYLLRAESYVRTGNLNAGLTDLNTLLKNRWDKNKFVPVSSSDATDILNRILNERRKELLMRNLRWADVKRLNKEGANISMQRVVNGKAYTLPANDLRFALPIPTDVIQLSGIQQNPN